MVFHPSWQPPPGVVLSFQAVRVIGNRALISGHGLQKPVCSFARPLGELGEEIIIGQGYAAARLTSLSILGSLQRALGYLDRIAAWTHVFGVFNSVPGFMQQPRVFNGVSDLILEVFGLEIGAHCSSAIGMIELPFNIHDKIEAEVEIYRLLEFTVAAPTDHFD